MATNSFRRKAASRRSVLAGIATLAVAPKTQAACAPPEVLFVCPYGTVKSAIAREVLKRRAAEAGVAVRVRSRGIDVKDHVSPQLAQRLRSDGVDPAAESAQQLVAADLHGRQIVIAFDEAAQDPRLAGARIWDVPSWNDRYDDARAALLARISALLAELKAQAPSGACS